MKAITASQLETTIGHILHDKESQAKVTQSMFIGVTAKEVSAEIEKRLGTDWILKKDSPVKLNKDDIAALANSRFFKKTGQKLMMGWALVVVILAMFTMTIKVIPLPVYYGSAILITGAFLVVFSQKQRAVRKELQQAVYGSDKVTVE